ncbi:MAG: hypothetical protein HY908_23945 [Myxococcales bacterium]|nr:hypothetical protein [Myxococcales bacterium]
MGQETSFLARVMQHVRSTGVTSYQFAHWPVPGKPTDEGVGLLPVPGIDAERLIARVLDVDHYVGNLNHVVECRTVADAALAARKVVRFYQRIKIPMLGDVHHELAFERLPVTNGFEVAAWHLLDKETAALSAKAAARSQYCDGAWLVAPGLIGYALSSAPRREDVGFLKWKALTTGADVAASKVVRENIECMARWAGKS